VWIEASSSLHPIHTATRGLEGFVDGQVDDGGRFVLSAGELSFPVARLASNNPLQDREMKRRIEARRYPTIDGRLTSVDAGADGAVRVHGDVTFKGVTRPCSDAMTIALDDDGVLRLTGASMFDVRDFGMQPPRILMLRVHPEVNVRVEIVARPA